MVTDPGPSFGFGLGVGFWRLVLWAELWSPSGVDPLVRLRPLPGFESSSFLAAEAVLLSLAFLIRSRPGFALRGEG